MSIRPEHTIASSDPALSRADRDGPRYPGPVRRVLELPPAAVIPDRADVLRTQGVPPEASVSDRVEALLGAAADRFAALARPRAVMQTIDRDAFAAILQGDGFEPADTPVGEVAPRADALALFVATLGQEVSDEIESLFAAGDFALGAMLDGVASEATEVLVAWLERFFRGVLYPPTGQETGAACCAPAGPGRNAPAGAMNRAPTESVGATCRAPTATTTAVLAYSPGYCGWPLTGQQRLFAAFDPAEIGVTLTSSCLMCPLKSVSGVLVAGPVQLHDVGQGFPCCASCSDPACRTRIARLRQRGALAIGYA